MAVPAHLGLGRPYDGQIQQVLTRQCHWIPGYVQSTEYSTSALKATSFTRVGFRPCK